LSFERELEKKTERNNNWKEINRKGQGKKKGIMNLFGGSVMKKQIQKIK